MVSINKGSLVIVEIAQIGFTMIQMAYQIHEKQSARLLHNPHL